MAAKRSKVDKHQKMKNKLIKLIAKTKELRKFRENELQSINIKLNELETLYQGLSEENMIQTMDRLQSKHNKHYIKKPKKMKHNGIKNRTETLPNCKLDIGGSDTLYLFIDANNIIEYGMREEYNEQSMNKLVQEISEFLREIKELKEFDYNISIYLWCDGNGENFKFGDINVEYSGNGRDINDILDVEFIADNYKNLLFITNAHGKKKHVFLRQMKLYKSGVTIFKSATFYNNYLSKE